MSTLTITVPSSVAIRFRRHCRLLGLTTSEAATQALEPWLEMQDDALANAQEPEEPPPPTPVVVASVRPYEPPTVAIYAATPDELEAVNQSTEPMGITVRELEVLP